MKVRAARYGAVSSIGLRWSDGSAHVPWSTGPFEGMNVV